VLRDSLIHAGAFSEGVLQRIIWARTMSEQMDDATSFFQYGQDGASKAGVYIRVLDMRAQFLSELMDLEKELR
jgi:hypothetical protein